MSKSVEEVLEESKAALRLYFNSEKDRIKLIGVRYATKLISMGLKLLIFASFGIVGSIFILTAIALFWGSYIDNYPLALIYTGLCVIGLSVIFYFSRNYFITHPIMRALIKEAFKDEE